jgi:hypothetical protein
MLAYGLKYEAHNAFRKVRASEGLSQPERGMTVVVLP